MKTNNPLNNPQRKSRKLGITFIFIFTVSVFFPVIASVVNRSNKVLAITGSFDVAIALACFVLFGALYIRNAKRVDDATINRTKRIVEYIAAVPLILIALYLSGLTLNWAILLIGLGWRFWLLIMAIPYLIVAFQQPG